MFQKVDLIGCSNKLLKKNWGLDGDESPEIGENGLMMIREFPRRHGQEVDATELRLIR